jgi:predicted ArsR family transcriptional regulator
VPDAELDRVIHQPVRTRIVAYLASHGPTDYVTLRNTLGLSDGHMTTHMRELIESEYVSFEKEFVDNKKPRTTYKLSPTGRKQFGAYIKALHEILKGE